VSASIATSTSVQRCKLKMPTILAGEIQASSIARRKTAGRDASFRVLVIRNDVVVIREVLVADGAYSALLENLSVQKFPHLCR